jgi:hypothetical protein
MAAPYTSEMLSQSEEKILRRENAILRQQLARICDHLKPLYEDTDAPLEGLRQDAVNFLENTRVKF